MHVRTKLMLQACECIEHHSLTKIIPNCIPMDPAIIDLQLGRII